MSDAHSFLQFLKQPMTDFSLFSDYAPIFNNSAVSGYISQTSQSDFISTLAPVLLQIDSFYASCFSLMAGAMTERGGNHTPIIQQVLTLLERQLRNLELYQSLSRKSTDQELFSNRPETVRAQYGISLTGFAAMTMLSRDVSARKAWQKSPIANLLEKFQEDYTPLDYLYDLYQLADDQELLVLDPTNRQGYLFRVVAIQNLYHCFTILDHRLLELAGTNYLGNSKPINMDTVHYAQNADNVQKLVEQREHDFTSEYQRFSFMTYAGLGKNISTLAPDDLQFYCFGSQRFQEIPTFEGRATLLVGPKEIDFNWNPLNMYPILHEALHSDVTLIRKLTETEVNGYFQRILSSK